jgi:hypothetical protein
MPGPKFKPASYYSWLLGAKLGFSPFGEQVHSRKSYSSEGI